MRFTPLFLLFFILLLACSIVAQQPGPPAGAIPAGGGDKNLQADDVKLRSIELERVKRDAAKSDRKGQTAPHAPAVANFEEIKQDFEAIQKLQDDIANTYVKGKEIDHSRISLDAAQMNQSAARLESNLFPADGKKSEKKKDDKKTAAQVASPPTAEPDLKSLIVEQDATIAALVSNPMFTNPGVVDAGNNAKVQADLQRLIKLSAALQQQADKLKK